MAKILENIKPGDSIHFELITSPVRVLGVEKLNEMVRLKFACTSGSWALCYTVDGRLDNHNPIIGCDNKAIPDAFDIIKVLPG